MHPAYPLLQCCPRREVEFHEGAVIRNQRKIVNEGLRFMYPLLPERARYSSSSRATVTASELTCRTALNSEDSSILAK
jgi:hypothetical protein